MSVTARVMIMVAIRIMRSRKRTNIEPRDRMENLLLGMIGNDCACFFSSSVEASLLLEEVEEAEE